MPSTWADVTVHDVRTEGAFLVSGVRRAGATRWVRVRSLAGEPCKVRHGIAGPIIIAGAEWRDLGDGVIELSLDKDQEALIYARDTRDFVIKPVEISEPGEAWGLPPIPPPGETVPVDLSAQFDNDGVSTHENMTDGDFDGSGYTYPAEEMPPAGPLAHQGLNFVFPGYADGAKNNVTAHGADDRSAAGPVCQGATARRRELRRPGHQADRDLRGRVDRRGALHHGQLDRPSNDRRHRSVAVHSPARPERPEHIEGRHLRGTRGPRPDQRAALAQPAHAHQATAPPVRDLNGEARPMTGISRRAFVLGSGAAALVATSPAAWAQAVPDQQDMHESILGDATMVWKRLPSGWQTAPFLGNALLGAHVYNKGGEGNVLRFMLNHSLVQDQRGQWEAAIGYSRLPIGYLTLTFAGSITGVDWALDLEHAELSGTVTTSQGSVRFTAVVLNHRSVLLVSLTPSAGEEKVAWGFQPLPSYTTRAIRRPPDYTGNPDPTAGPGYVEQIMHAGGGYTTAWREVRQGTQRLLAATVAYGYPDSTGLDEAVRTVNTVLDGNPDAQVLVHRQWWKHFYRRSLISIPDKKLQRFYWTQLYKLASATRENEPVVTEWGPWFPEVGNSWTNIWWNLNVRVSYPMINGSNHRELDAVAATFRKYHANLESNVEPAYRDGSSYALCHPGDRMLRPGPRYVGVPGVSPNDHTGNLTWGMHNVWLAYRHSMDESVLREVLYPILTKAINYYARFLVEGNDGRLHLPETRSPEYANASDATYDLSLIRWGCRTLLDSADRLRIDDPLKARWQDILARLVPYHRTSRA
jgi:hypothetical protein